MSEECDECEDGTYSLNGASSCITCQEGCQGYCDKTTGKCTGCKSGYGFTTSKDCIKCTKGNYGQGGTYSCSRCEIDKYTTTDGQSQCNECSSTCRDYSETESKCNYQTGNCIQCNKGFIKIGLECNLCSSKCPYELNTPELLKKNLADYQNVLKGNSKV